MPTNKISQAYVEVTVEGADKAARDIRAVAGTTKSAGTQAAASGKSFKDFAGDLQASSEKAQELQSKIAGSVGVFGAVAAASFAAGNALFELSQQFDNGEKRAQKFLDELRDTNKGFRDAEAEASAIRDRLEEINALLANRNTVGGTQNLFFQNRTLNGVYEEQAALLEDLQRLNVTEQRSFKDRELLRQKEADATRQQAEATNEALEAQIALSQAAQAQDPAERARLQSLAAEITAKTELAQLDRQIEQERSRADEDLRGGVIAQLERRRDLVVERTRLEIQGIRQTAQAEIDAAEEINRKQKQLDQDRADAQARLDEENAKRQVELARATAEAVAQANADALAGLAQQQAAQFDAIFRNQSQEFSRLTDLLASAARDLADIRRQTRT